MNATPVDLKMPIHGVVRIAIGRATNEAVSEFVWDGGALTMEINKIEINPPIYREIAS